MEDEETISEAKFQFSSEILLSFMVGMGVVFLLILLLLIQILFKLYRKQSQRDVQPTSLPYHQLS